MNGNYTKQRTMANAGIISENSVGYITDTVRATRNEQVLPFPGQNLTRAKVIQRVNSTLGCLLLGAILVSAISYFFVVSNEIKLNEYSRETARLNVQNAELENKLDKLKSFNNVDLAIQKNKKFKNPQRVIDVPGNVSQNNSKKLDVKPKAKAWVIGY